MVAKIKAMAEQEATQQLTIGSPPLAASSWLDMPSCTLSWRCGVEEWLQRVVREKAAFVLGVVSKQCGARRP